jgi:ribonuclease HI
VASKKVYVVEVKTGKFRTFHNWPECQRFVSGKPYLVAGGATEAEARAKIRNVKRQRAAGGGSVNKAKKSQTTAAPSGKPREGITSDAGTHGNPGPSEYQITDMAGNRLEHKKLGVHSNNYAELAGILAMIEYAVKHGESILWTDSQIALGWIKTGRIGERVHERDKIVAMVSKIRVLRVRNPKIQLKKWDTKHWGQIPSDFGRK